jgi:chromosome segregation ATPase
MKFPTVKELLATFAGTEVVTEETTLTAEQLTQLNEAAAAQAVSAESLAALTTQVAEMTTERDNAMEQLTAATTELTTLKAEKATADTSLAEQIALVATQEAELATLRAWKAEQGITLKNAEDTKKPAQMVSPMQQAANEAYAKLHKSA